MIKSEALLGTGLRILGVQELAAQVEEPEAAQGVVVHL